MSVAETLTVQVWFGVPAEHSEQTVLINVHFFFCRFPFPESIGALLAQPSAAHFKVTASAIATADAAIMHAIVPAGLAVALSLREAERELRQEAPCAASGCVPSPVP